MATAQARAVSENIGVKADFGEYDKLWKHNPHIAKPGNGFPVKNSTGDRPYLLGQTDKKCIFNPNYRAVPGDIYIDHNEFRESRKALNGIEDFILIQPEVKRLFSKWNKAWPRKYWKELVNLLEGENLVQMLKDKSETEEALGIKTIETGTFRTAVAVVMKAKMLITCDGGLHHAAAARIYDSKGYLLSEGTPSVVIWTGFTHPRNLGYAKHINVRYDDTPPCGMKEPCDHCHDMAEKLKPEMVYKAVREYLDKLSTSLDQRKRAG